MYYKLYLLEDRSESGLFDRSWAQPVSGLARTVSWSSSWSLTLMFPVVFSTILYLILVERKLLPLTCALQDTEKVANPHYGSPSRRKVINHHQSRSNPIKEVKEVAKE